MSFKSAANVLKKWIPSQLKFRIIAQIEQKKQQKFLTQLKSKIQRFYEAKTSVTAEEAEVMRFLRSNPISVFPYDFQHKYDKSMIKVLHDDANGLNYVIHLDKRLYFKRSYSTSKIRSLYHGLLLDQDPDSPHLYLTSDFGLDKDSVIADIGAAEGNFSLSNVEMVKKIYLFECDSEWIEALEATFSPWKDKVVICNKFVSNIDSKDAIALDTFVASHDDINFLKVDIEGEEARFLEGARGFLQSKNRQKMAICTYHKQQDEMEFTNLLKGYDFEVEASNGYMIFYHDQMIKEPYLRRGLLRAQKKRIEE